MRILLQLALILGICYAGDLIHKATGIPVPGNILGMLILLILLCIVITVITMAATGWTVQLLSKKTKDK